jgi:hypothetical protein
MFSLGAITKFIVVFVIVLVEFYTFSSNWSLHAQGATFFKCLAPLARSFLKNLLEMGFFFLLIVTVIIAVKLSNVECGRCLDGWPSRKPRLLPFLCLNNTG